MSDRFHKTDIHEKATAFFAPQLKISWFKYSNLFGIFGDFTILRLNKIEFISNNSSKIHQCMNPL